MATLLSPAIQAQPAQSVAVKTAALIQQTLTDTIDGFGTVSASDTALTDLSFFHAGQISQLHVRQSETVHAGQPIIELTADPATLLSYEKARATLDFANRDLERMRTLVLQQLATNAQLAAAQKAAADAEAALATERRLGNDQRTEIARAPFDGYVVSISVAPGDHVAAGAPVLKLARTDQGAHVLMGLEPEDARRVRSGMTAHAALVFAPDQQFQGKVQSIAGAMNPTTKRADLWINLPDAAVVLPVGSAVTVKIDVATRTGWVVPRQAVLHDRQGDYVFQIANGKARRIAVKVGLGTDHLTEISGSLDPSLRIVVLGNYELQDGMAVREETTKTDAKLDPVQ
ncbi:MAG: efflux RND transporter periplasmic adaptor subunit [Proteobacteria bacterium]|nr:efflux RND transporter periplasmic adaptor subunit [Pseudomonadota bacterium]